MRIGYFGGTFDPPHRAHLKLARAAADSLHLDRVLLAPTGLQPLKQAAPAGSFADRLAMVRLLCAGEDRMEASALDAPHADGSPNYTVEALESLRQQFAGATLYALTGADSFLSLPLWREPQKLLELAEWIVVTRPGFPLDDLSALQLTVAQRARVHLLPGMDDTASASGIRERLKMGVSCGDTLTPAVALYIARMHLYHAR